MPAKSLNKIPSDRRAIAKRLWRLSYPTMISFGLESFYDIVDMAWVGQISKEALSGVTIFSTLYMLFTVLNEIAGDASISLISQYYGRGEHEKTQLVAEQTISFKVVLAFCSLILMLLFIDPIMRFYSSDARVVSEGLRYGYFRIFFIPVLFASYSVNTIFRCTQDTVTPMKIMILSAVLNLILDPLLMFEQVPFVGLPGAGLGVLGAAVATIISSAVAFLYGFILLLSGRKGIRISFRGLFRLDAETDKKLFFVGLPTGLQLFVRQFFNAALIKFIASYGTTAIALAGINGKLNGFMVMPIFGMTMGGATLVGAALGRNEIKQAETIARVDAWVNAAMVGGVGLLTCLLAPQLMGLFSQDPVIIQNGVPMLYIMAVDLVLMAFGCGLKIVFSGSGYNRPKLITTLLSRWVIQLPAALLVVYAFRLPLIYFWATYVLADAFDLLVSLYYFRQPTWRYNRV